MKEERIFSRTPGPPILIALALSLCTACDSPTGPGSGLQQPRQTGDGWETASLESVGMEAGPLRSLLDRINGTQDHRIHSLLIVKDQKLVFRESSSATLIDFAEEHLFSPLGIDTFQRTRFGSAPEVTFASGGASLRPRDMAKLGALYLNGGVWNGVRILSPEWVDESVEMAVPLVPNYQTEYGYGYNWWLGRFQLRGEPVEYFRAAGWGGQDVFVIPDLEMVIVFTAGGYYESRPLSVNAIIQDFIFQAVMD